MDNDINDNDNHEDYDNNPKNDYENVDVIDISALSIENDDISQQLLNEVLANQYDTNQYDDSNMSLEEDLSYVTADSRGDSREVIHTKSIRMSNSNSRHGKRSSRESSRGGGDDNSLYDSKVPINEWNIDWPGNTNDLYGSSIGSLADASYASETELASMSAALNEAEEGIVQLRKRLKRRVGLIAHIRNAYLKDVVTLKHVINDVLTNNERQEVMEQYNVRLPSLDLKQYLELYGPKNSKVTVKPCEECGGFMEIMLDVGDTVRKLEAEKQYQKEKEEKLRIKIAELDFLIEQEKSEKGESLRSHNDEKRVLYNEIRKLKEELEIASTENVRVLKENKKMRDQVHIFKEVNTTLVQGNEALKETEENLKLEKEETVKLKNKLTALEKNIKEKDAELIAKTSENKNLEIIKAALTQELQLLKIDFEEMTTKADRFQKQSEVLEENLLAANKKNVETDLKLREAREDFANLEAHSQKEAADLQNKIDKGREEINFMETMVKDKNSECISLRSDLEDTRKVVIIKDRTIKERDNALMDAASHHEALEEEISAMKQFLFDAVAAKTSTPMRRAGTADFDDMDEEGTDEEEAGDNDNDTYTSEIENAPGDVAGMADLFAEGSVGASTSDSISRPSTSDQRPSTSDFRPSTSDFRPSTSDFKPYTTDEKVDNAESNNFPATNNNFNTSTAAPQSISVDTESPADISVTPTAGGKKSPASVSTTPKGNRRGSRLERERQPSMHRRKTVKLNANTTAQDESQESDSPGLDIKQKKSIKIESQICENEEVVVDQRATTPGKKSSSNVKFETTSEIRENPSVLVAEKPASKAIKSGGGVQAKTQTGKPVKTPPANEKKSALGRSKPKPFVPPVDEIVELNPLRPDALPEEIMLRSALLAELTGSIGANKANKAINCAEKTIEEFGAKLNKTLESLWEAMILDKKSLDFFVKIEKILAGILTCMVNPNPDNPDEKPTTITSAHIALACAEIVPLAQASVGTKLTAHWQEECALEEHIVSALTPMVDFQTGAISYKAYNEFFGMDNETQLERVDFAMEALKRMQSYADDSLLAVGEELVDVIKEWSESKTVYVELDLIIEKEKNKVKTELTKQINSLKDDLMRQTKKTEYAKEMVKNLESKAEDLEVRVNYLEPFPEKLNKSEKLNEKKEKEIVELKRTVDRLNGEVSKLTNLKANLTRDLESTNQKLSKTNEDLLIATNTITRLDKELREMTDLSNKRGEELAMLYEKERKRLECQVHCDMQTDPEINNVGCQTEFINPPMTLRTVIATAYNKAGERQRFPVVTSKGLENPYSHAEEKLLQKLARSNGFSHLGKTSRSLEELPSYDRFVASDVSALDEYESSESSSARIIEDYVEDINVSVNISSPYLRAKSPPSDLINDIASPEIKVFRNRNPNPEYAPNNKAISRYRKKIPALSQELLALHEKAISSSSPVTPGSKGNLRIGIASPLRLGTSGSVLSEVVEGSSICNLSRNNSIHR